MLRQLMQPLGRPFATAQLVPERVALELTVL
jgi:hypothetical protein